MRRPNRIPALLLLLLLVQTALSQQHTPAAPTLLSSVERQLSRALFARTCPAFKAASQAILSRRLQSARSCVYHDLSFEQFSRLRTQCRRRRRLQMSCALMRSESVCAQLRHVREICAMIGFTRDTRRFCARIKPLESFTRINDRLQCPTDVPSEQTVAQLQRRAARLADRRRISAALPKPAYELRVVEPIVGPATSLMVLLHGFSGSISDWDETVDLMRASGFRRTRFIIPQAPVARLDVFGQVGPSWFNVFSSDVDAPQANDEIIAAAQNIRDILDVQHVVHGIAYEKMGVFGFSQGGALALTVYLRHAIGAVSGYSTYVPIVDTYPEALSNESAQAPALLFHGDADVIIPVEVGRLTEQALLALGRSVTYTEFEGVGHNLRPVFDFAVDKTIQFMKQTIV